VADSNAGLKMIFLHQIHHLSYQRRLVSRFILSILFVCLIVGCSHQKETSQNPATITVSKQANVDTLYLNGTIEPIKIISVIAPFDGTLTQKHFDYGELLKQGQELFWVDSSQFNDTYQEALTNYLKAKKDYASNVNKMRGTEELKRLGIISRDEYQSAQNQLYDSSLSLAQAKRKLQDILTKANNKNFNLTNLNIDNTAVINNLLQSNNNILKIYSPSNGIALLPTKSASSSDDTNKPLHVGDQIKAGQILLTVGDISGIVLSVKINEIHINNIKVGQQATITSNAFKDTLIGHVTHVDQQATQDNTDSIPSFTVKIAVPSITDVQRKDIHVGMSAKVALQVTKPSTISIPLTAVIDNNGQTTVKVLDKNTKQFKQVPVVVGATSIDSVVIQKGLKPGDEVLVNANH
jgi:multidrug efflux pump subunit AcrA (membrane-fusion protein)